MSCDFLALANAGVQKLSPYQPGKPVEELERELGIRDIVKLASNENPLGPSPRAVQAARSVIGDVHRYPDGSGFRLKAALAEYLGVRSAQITLGNGSNDVLELVGRVFLRPGCNAVFSEHAFAVYPLVTLAAGATPKIVKARNWGHDLEAMAAAVDEQTRIGFVANPNHPTGTWIESDALQRFLDAVPGNVIVVLDEAYFEYLAGQGFPDGMQYLERYSNLMVTRTFSKAYGLAGLRIGYAVSNDAVADLMNRVRQPFNTNSLALAAAEAALHDNDWIRQSVAVNAQGYAQLSAGLDALHLKYIASRGNFLCVEFDSPGREIYSRLLAEGVIVRPVDAYGMPQFLRVSIGTEAENARFLSALQKVLHA